MYVLGNWTETPLDSLKLAVFNIHAENQRYENATKIAARAAVLQGNGLENWIATWSAQTGSLQYPRRTTTLWNATNGRLNEYFYLGHLKGRAVLSDISKFAKNKKFAKNERFAKNKKFAKKKFAR